MSLNLNISNKSLVEFCNRWMVEELALFGSILRDDFSDESDIDVLVTFKAGAQWTLFDLTEMRDELMTLFGRQVDLVTRGGLETSRNYLRRESILSNAEVIYAS